MPSMTPMMSTILRDDCVDRRPWSSTTCATTSPPLRGHVATRPPPAGWPGARCRRSASRWRSALPSTRRSPPASWPAARCAWTGRGCPARSRARPWRWSRCRRAPRHDARQAVVHVLQGGEQLAGLVRRCATIALAQVAARDAVGHLHGVGERPRDRARDQPRGHHADHAGQHRRGDHDADGVSADSWAVTAACSICLPRNSTISRSERQVGGLGLVAFAEELAWLPPCGRPWPVRSPSW